MLNAYWEESGEEPRRLDHRSGLEASFGRSEKPKCLPEADLAKLDDIRAAMEEYRHGGLTEKNLKVIRAVLTEGVWDKVVQAAPRHDGGGQAGPPHGAR